MTLGSAVANEHFKSILNFRPAVFAAAFLAAGVGAAALLRDNDIAFLAVFCVLLVLCAVFTACKKRWRAVFMLAAALGFVGFFTSFYSGSVGVTAENNAVLTGRVKYISLQSEEQNYYILEQLTVNGETVKMNAYLKTSEALEVGDVVTFLGRVESFELDPFDSYSMSFFRKKVRWTAEGENVALVRKTKLSVYEKVRTNLKTSFAANMGAEESGVALALILGDSSLISDELYDAVSASGLIHLFSVSGLHVGFLAGVIFFIARLFKRTRRASFIAAAGILTFYGILTGFPAGVSRAMVMILVLLAAEICSERYDPLSALAVSVIIILLASPLSLFELGFQLSVTAVLGIICFYPSFSRAFRPGKSKISNYVGNSVALSLSANSFLTPVAASAFGTVALYFVIANIVMIPYTSLIYCLSTVIGALCLINPALDVLLVPIGYLLTGFNAFVYFIGSLPSALWAIAGAPLSAFLFVVTTFFCSKFVMVDKKYKFMTAPPAFLFAFILAFFNI